MAGTFLRAPKREMGTEMQADAEQPFYGSEAGGVGTG
eukprot:COSAG01_NODE_6500_length_3630_cov_10.141886_6_plen_36_part_01